MLAVVEGPARAVDVEVENENVGNAEGAGRRDIVEGIAEVRVGYERSRKTIETERWLSARK
jgi:hypothetical protein